MARTASQDYGDAVMPEFRWTIKVTWWHHDGKTITDERWVALMENGIVCNIRREQYGWEWKIGQVIGGPGTPYAAIRIGATASIEQAKRECEAAYREMKAEYASV